MDESTTFYVDIAQALLRVLARVVDLPEKGRLETLMAGTLLAIEGSHYQQRQLSLIRSIFFRCNYTQEEFVRSEFLLRCL